MSKITGTGHGKITFPHGITPLTLSIFGRKANHKLSITGSSFNSIQGMKRGGVVWDRKSYTCCCVVLCRVVSKILFKALGDTLHLHSASRICTLQDKGEFGTFQIKGRVRACMVNQCPAWQSIIDKKAPRQNGSIATNESRGESGWGRLLSGHQLEQLLLRSTAPLALARALCSRWRTEIDLFLNFLNVS